MSLLDDIRATAAELTAWRRDFHAHPEIGREEKRTSAVVAEKLKSFGLDVHEGVGGYGVVAVLKGTKGRRARNRPESRHGCAAAYRRNGLRLRLSK